MPNGKILTTFRPRLNGAQGVPDLALPLQTESSQINPPEIFRVVPQAGYNSSSVTVDQAVITAGLLFRRYAMKPRPARPVTSIAQVVGSGTAVALGNVTGP